MLARKYNLKGKDNFEKVKEKGKIFQSTSFGIASLKREGNDKEDSKFGFIVSTKISGEAVQRNRIKRAMCEAVRFLLTDIKKGYDFVFLAKQISTRKSTDELMKEVKIALKDSKFIK